MKSVTIKNNIYVARDGGADISKFILYNLTKDNL